MAHFVEIEVGLFGQMGSLLSVYQTLRRSNGYTKLEALQLSEKFRK